MDEKRNYKFVLPNGNEHFETVDFQSWKGSNGDQLRNAVESFVRFKSGLTTNRKEPTNIKVKVFRQEIEGGKIKDSLVADYSVTPAYEPMTQEEYDSELKDLLEHIPKAFHPMVRQRAWEEGHSSGLESVIQAADSLITDLQPAIEIYRQSLIPDSKPRDVHIPMSMRHHQED